MAKKVLSLEEASELTGYSAAYIYKLCSHGKIPHYKPTARRIVFLEEELLDYLLRNRRAADYELEAEADRRLTSGKAKVAL